MNGDRKEVIPLLSAEESRQNSQKPKLIVKWPIFAVLGIILVLGCGLATALSGAKKGSKLADRKLDSFVQHHAEGLPKPLEYTEKQKSWLQKFWSCTTPECMNWNSESSPIKNEFVARKMRKSRRKEIRSLSEEERRILFRAIRRLKQTQLDGIALHDLIVSFHLPIVSPAAHFGPAFLPWHRQYLTQWELLLKLVEPKVQGIPYWDSTLDKPLPDPRHSIIWTPEFYGSGQDGPIVDGPFANWVPLTPWNGSNLVTRSLGTYPNASLFDPQIVDMVMAYEKYEDLTFCFDPTFELLHGYVHFFVGGFMVNFWVSPNDPVFFFHHCFIDYLWEMWRQRRQTRSQRETEYPADGPDSCIFLHNADAEMSPFPIRNRDGLKNSYTDFYYDFEEKPSCSSNAKNSCEKSPYLFCGPQRNCMSKIRMGGNCTGLEQFNACRNSKCIDGVCEKNSA